MLNFAPSSYKTHIFDCDGVLLNSNVVKERCFYQAVEPLYGADAANALVAYHRTAGATGRRARVDHFFDSILGRAKSDEAEADALFDEITRLIAEAYQDVTLNAGAFEYLAALRVFGCRLVVVSGVEQEELERILDYHHINELFDDVIGTSDKTHALYDLLKKGTPRPAVYYGDTSDDFRASVTAGVDTFMLMYGSSTDPTLDAARDFGRIMRPRSGT